MTKIVKKVFTYEVTPYHPGKFLVRPIFEALPLTYTTGSYNIIEARLMGLSYADYLRYCRDVVGAEIIGKGCPYPVPYFQEGEKLNKFINTLNQRANYILDKKENNK